MEERTNGGENPRIDTYEEKEELKLYWNARVPVFAGSTFFMFQIDEVDTFVKRKLTKYIKNKKRD